MSAQEYYRKHLLGLRKKNSPSAPSPAAANMTAEVQSRCFFISHAKDADGATALALAMSLEKVGQTCWVAPRDISAGADWNASILAAIENCDVFVLLVSEQSQTSAFVKAEVQHAFERQRTITPVLLSSGLSPEKIDLRLNTRQRIEVGETTAAVAQRLLAIRRS